MEKKQGGSQVLYCGCHHPQQDALHGKGMRVHNNSGLNPKESKWHTTCTVCLRQRAA